MDNAQLETIYRRYIDALNGRRLDDLVDFVNDDLFYNGQPMTRLDYRNRIARDIQVIPDLTFNIDLVVVRSDHVACRLTFDCTPRGEFLGLQPTGKTVSFAEHVFYRFRDGRIAEVWSLIDRPSVEAQLAA